MNVILCDQSAIQGNDFDLTPTVVERGDTIEGPIGREFSSIYP